MAKTVVSLGLAAALLVLAGCSGNTDTTAPTTSPSASGPATPSGSGTPSATPEKVTPSKDFSKVAVAGDYGKAPKVTVKKPWGIDKTRTKVIKESDGQEIKAGTSVEVSYFGVNARTGKTFDESFTTGKPVAFSLEQVVPGLNKGLVGQKKGSRVMIAMPGPDGYDAQGGNAQAGINVGDTLIFVVDIVGATLDGPEGDKVTPKGGLPTVVDKNGTPEISIKKTDPPKELQVQPLVKGKGAKVAETDAITFRYRWVTWSNGKVVEENYGKAPATAALKTLLPGLQKGLVNQTVGSRVLLVVPPADGYPDGNATPKIGKSETLVFVVDILFSQAGQ